MEDEPEQTNSLIEYLEADPRALDEFLRIHRRITNPLYRIWDDTLIALKKIFALPF